MALIAARYFVSAVLGMVAMFSLCFTADMYFDFTGWRDEIIAADHDKKIMFERAGWYTESFREERGRLPSEGELRSWAMQESGLGLARGMVRNMHIAAAGESCLVDKEDETRNYHFCYIDGQRELKYEPQSGYHNLKLRPSDFRLSLDYWASGLAMILVPLLLAIWAWPGKSFRHEVQAAKAAT